jgi:plasmid maintenance system antidote protein VapI
MKQRRNLAMPLNKQIIKGAIITRFGSQVAAAPVLGIHERRLSRLLNGHDRIRAEEVRVLQEKLGVQVEITGEQDAAN